MAGVKTATLDGIAEITFDRPDRFNAFDVANAVEFRKAVESAASDAAVRALLITGEGKAFSAGGDVQDFQRQLKTDPKTAVRCLTGELHPALLTLRSMDKPSVCALNGVAAGGGMGVALACDVIIASERAKLTPSFLKVGLVPDSGTTWSLPRAVGWKRAQSLFFLNDAIDAEEGRRLGLFAKVVDHEALMPTAREVAKTLSGLPPFALQKTRELIDRGSTKALEEQLVLERELNGESATKGDFAEGVNAFVEKRPPRFAKR